MSRWGIVEIWQTPGRGPKAAPRKTHPWVGYMFVSLVARGEEDLSPEEYDDDDTIRYDTIRYDTVQRSRMSY